MKPAPFDYVRPSTIAQACEALAEAGGGATVIAGGQTLMPLLNLRMSQPFVLIDLGGIPELQGVTPTKNGLRIGPMTRQNDALSDALVQQRLPVLAESLRHVGHHQTRNRGTLGGSIAFGEPAAESPATALALGASLELQSARGKRQVPLEAFYFGPYSTAIEPDELITAIDYPAWPEGHVTLFQEVTRRPGDFALVGLVGAVSLSGNTIAQAGIAWFGMGATPIRAQQAEAALVGADIATLDAAAIAELAVADTQPFDDKAASAEYRRTVGRKIFAETLRSALDARAAA